MIHPSRVLTMIVIGFGMTLVAIATAVAQTDDAAIKTAAETVADIPREARQRQNPLATDAEAFAWGKQIYSSQCTMCHGLDGAGTGDLVERLLLPIPDFTATEMQAQRTDGALFYIIAKGHGQMRGREKRFDERTLWSLVNHVRSFGPDN